jgi:hypothetical protein
LLGTLDKTLTFTARAATTVKPVAARGRSYQGSETMKLLKILPVLLAGLLLFGCNDTEVPVQKTPKAKPEFVHTDDPKAFFASYLQDLSGDRFMPPELYQMLHDRTQMPPTIELIDQHDTLAFLQWYFADSYLNQVRAYADEKVVDMDYSLKVMHVSSDQAVEVIMLSETVPVLHKAQLLAGEVAQSWHQLDENRYEVLLSQGNWQGKVGVGRENGQWKLIPLSVEPRSGG